MSLKIVERWIFTNKMRIFTAQSGFRCHFYIFVLHLQDPTVFVWIAAHCAICKSKHHPIFYASSPICKVGLTHIFILRPLQIKQRLWPGNRTEADPAIALAKVVSRCLMPQESRAKAREIDAILKVSIHFSAIQSPFHT